MKADFFSASSKDHHSRITFKASDLDLSPKKGDRYIVSILRDNVEYDVLFTCNREDKTLKCTSWPQGLPTLSIGLTLRAEITNVIKV